jgi:hypothetical protein
MLDERSRERRLAETEIDRLAVVQHRPG